MGLAALSGVSVRDEDIESTTGLRSVGMMMLRALAALVLVLMVAEIVSALGGPGDVAWHVRFAEAVRLAIVSALLWGAAEFAAFCIKAHGDLRATRILMARLVFRLPPAPGSGDARPVGGGDRQRG